MNATRTYTTQADTLDKNRRTVAYYDTITGDKMAQVGFVHGDTAYTIFPIDGGGVGATHHMADNLLEAMREIERRFTACGWDAAAR